MDGGLMTNFTNALPRRLYRAAQIQQLDRVVIEEFSITGFRLMQAAGAAAFNALLEQWPRAKRLLVFTGAGKNGGDGYIVAGLAKDFGMMVEIIQVGERAKCTGDAKQAFEWAEKQQVTMTSFADFQQQESVDYSHTIMVDALLGTGLNREVTGEYKLAIERINNAGYPVLAIDIPSGLNADTGRAMGAAVNADLTVTFIGLKQGLLTGQGRDFVGILIFNDLDVPDEVYSHDSSPSPAAQRIDINYASKFLASRPHSSHKGDYGHVVIVGGNYGYGGAALMAAEAAQRSGAGLVSVITRSAHRPAFLGKLPEIMMFGTEDEEAPVDELLARASVIVIGPGLGRSEWSRTLLQLALSKQVSAGIPLVVDADGLNLLSERSDSKVVIKRDNWILTPHAGEAARLLGSTVADVQADRFAAVTELYNRWGGCCLLKGSGSLIAAPNEELFLCTEGNAGMASGGLGDVLSGVIAGLVAQKLTLPQSLCCAVCIHGEAADLAMEAGGQRGMIATDLSRHIRQLVNPTH